MIALEYARADGAVAPVRFSADSQYILVQTDGLGSTRGNAVSIRGPHQIGAKVIDANVEPRSVGVQVHIVGDSEEEFWSLRSELVRALAVQPARHGQAFAPGRLTVYRHGDATPLEVDAVPVASPQEVVREGWQSVMDIEFFIPDPRWRETLDRIGQLQPGGGFTFPLTHPFTMPAHNLEIEIDNVGDTDTPVFIRIFGGITAPQIVNVTTGETIGIVTEIDPTEYVDIDTTFGQKKIELVAADGTRTNIMSDLDFDYHDFWHLQPGVNRIRLDYSANPSGEATLLWRPRYSGV